MDQNNECQNTFYYCRKFKDSNEWQCKNNQNIPYEYRRIKPKMTDSKVFYAECNKGVNFEDMVKKELGPNTKFFEQEYRCNEKPCLWRNF